MTQPTIAAQGSTYQYGDLFAVDPISFGVAEGEVLSFLEPKRNDRCLIPG
jgi:ABC-type Fe3+/spermidine/putrescine transport system ATPase subunit